jgi:hypothetical protein
MFIKPLLKSYVCMSNWDDALAPCNKCVYPCITIVLSNVDPNKKDRLIEVLRQRQVPFALFNMLGYTAIESCNFAVTFDNNDATIVIDPPKDKTRQAIEFIFDLLRETGLDPKVTVDEVVNEYKGFPIKIVDGKITSGVTTYREMASKAREWYKGLLAMFGEHNE